MFKDHKATSLCQPAQNHLLPETIWRYCKVGFFSGLKDKLGVHLPSKTELLHTKKKKKPQGCYLKRHIAEKVLQFICRCMFYKGTKIIILQYSDIKGNLYCTPVVLLHCALLVPRVAYEGSPQVFKKNSTCFKRQVLMCNSQTCNIRKMQLQSI